MSAKLPVAIIGIGCKFPGGSDNKDLYYEFLRRKGDGMTKPPPDRWDHDEWQSDRDEPGKYNSAMSGFINGINTFDPLEFGISINEAQHMDPSLRLALEVAHETLVDSGIDYRGSDTGVYFAQLLTSTSELVDDRYEINNHHGLGKCIALRANRVSYTFDLHGPSMALDTACSSSATALHLALSAIRLGEIDQALIIGGNAIVYPEHMVFFSKLGVLSPTGSSKSFDASADGYARAEGFAGVLIKRLDAAVTDGDNIYSVITGSSINCNGKGISLTMPRGDMQAECIVQAYASAKRSPSEAFFVELHSTGTVVGDPIETNAAGRVFSEGREKNKVLRIGSVKGNLGHTEGCSFLASLIKVSLMLKNMEIIPNIRYDTPNPKISFAALLMKVQTELEPITPDFAAPDGKWVASVSSHGIGGSNAHLVLESFESASSASDSLKLTTSPKPAYLFLFSALTESTAISWKDSLSEIYNGVDDDNVLRSLSYDLGRRSRSSPARAYAVGSTLSPELPVSKPVTNITGNPRLCLVFAGQGPQHISMGKGLSLTYIEFLDSVVRSDTILVKKWEKKSFLERSGLFVPNKDVKLSPDGIWPVEDVVYSIVFMQLALVDLLKSFEVKYHYVVGHSLGEIAMGYAAGCYGQETAVGIAIARAEAMTKADGNGSMAALGVGLQKATSMIKMVLRNAGTTTGLWIAGINSPLAVTVSGRQELIDMLVKQALDSGVFVQKLRVKSGFHTALMDPQEALFRTLFESMSLIKIRPPEIRALSTVHGDWLERDLDVDYWWDNIRQPVLFGGAIDKIVRDDNSDNILFLELAPHPVLNGYIHHCGGKPFSLVYRPNAKVPSQNGGEPGQFLGGVGQLLCSGFKAISLAKLFGIPKGTSFLKCKFPPYPYHRTLCWSEFAGASFVRLRKRSRPLESNMFRMSVDTHPELSGHFIFDTSLFPASGYIESAFENGAMVVNDVHFHRPLVLGAHDTKPAHVGCIVHGNKWEFRGATTQKFDDGGIQLDAVYASGALLRQNHRFDPEKPRVFDIDSRLALSQRSFTGDEFYNALPSEYGYRDHFAKCIKEIHELPDENSWHGLAYLVKLDISAWARGVDGNYIVHPYILDSAMHSALAVFVVEGKLASSSGVFLPVAMDSITRWDRGGFGVIDFHNETDSELWSYVTVRDFAPEGPIKFDYTITRSRRQVLFTIECLEFALAPRSGPVHITDEKRLTLTWQPKRFPSSGIAFASVAFTDVTSCLYRIFQNLITKAQVDGYKIVRVLDLDSSLTFAMALDASLISFLRNGLHCDYFLAVASAEHANASSRILQYPHVRPFICKTQKFDEMGQDLMIASFDVMFLIVDPWHLPTSLQTLVKYLVPHGVMLLLVSRHDKKKADYRRKLSAFIRRLRRIPSIEVSETTFDENCSLVLARSTAAGEPSTSDVLIYHLSHGNEGQLVNIVKNLLGDCELWIVGNEDPPGRGAMATAACLLAETPAYRVHSMLFEDFSLCPEDREKVIHAIRKNPLLLEQHMKYSRHGEIFVRRLIYAYAPLKDITVSNTGLTRNPEGVVSAFFPQTVGEFDVQVVVDILAPGSFTTDRPILSFIGRVTQMGAGVKSLGVGCRVCGMTIHPVANIIIINHTLLLALPDKITTNDAAVLSASALVAWLALLKHARITDQSVILLHDAGSSIGFYAVQICQHIHAKFLCAVTSISDVEHLTAALNVDPSSVTIMLPGGRLKSHAIQTWLSTNKLRGFDVAFNTTGRLLHSAAVNFLTAKGCYIHNHINFSELVDISIGAPTTHIIDIAKLILHCPSDVSSTLLDLLLHHVSTPFQHALRSFTFSELASADPAASNSMSLVAKPDDQNVARINPNGQLFDPRKMYLLIGGSSELGVRIAQWMAKHGACHILLTSRRGSKALSNPDFMILRHLRLAGVSLEVFAANALNKEEMAGVVKDAEKVAPVGGIFLMTVVLRDGIFSHLNQESFDDVYLSKVHALNTLLSCVDPSGLDFLLLFSTIGSVFGNAGQATYCSSQAYFDRVAETLPNTVSISLPPITDAGIFKRLIFSMDGHAHAQRLLEAGVTVSQACEFIGDAVIRRIPHYVPMMDIQNIPKIFPTCDPLLYGHLLPANLESQSGKEKSATTPTTLLSRLVGVSVDQISKDAVITSFGLDSLGAVRYSNDLKVHCNIHVSQIELLGIMTIGQLDQKLGESSINSAEVDSGANIDDGTAKYGLPLSAIAHKRLVYGEAFTIEASPHQCQMFFAHNETSKGVHITRSNHEAFFIMISSPTPVDVGRINEVVTQIIQRHEALRTTFSLDKDGKPQQTIHPTGDFEVRVVDLTHDAQAMEKAYEISSAANQAPNFCFDQSPILLMTLFNLGNNKWAFNTIIHHIIMDEKALGIFFYELFTLYLTRTDVLAPPALHLSDVTEWISRTSDCRIQLRNEQLKLWSENLRDVHPLRLHPETYDGALSSSVTRLEAVIDARTLRRYNRLISDAGVTSFTGFFAAFNLLLYKWSLQSSFVVDTTTAQRNIIQLTNVIGFFANTLPIKTTITDDQSFSQYLTGFRTDLVKCLENGDVESESICQAVGVPQPKHLFAYGGLHLDAISGSGLDGIEVQSVSRLLDVTDQYEFHLTLHGDSGRMVLHFDNHLHSEEVAKYFLDGYIILLKNLGPDPHVKIRDVSSTIVTDFDCMGVRFNRVGEGDDAIFVLQ